MPFLPTVNFLCILIFLELDRTDLRSIGFCIIIRFLNSSLIFERFISYIALQINEIFADLCEEKWCLSSFCFAFKSEQFYENMHWQKNSQGGLLINGSSFMRDCIVIRYNNNNDKKILNKL